VAVVRPLLLLLLLLGCEAPKEQEGDSEPPRRRRSTASESTSERRAQPLAEIMIDERDGSFEVNEDALLQVIALAHAGELPLSTVLGGGYRVERVPEGSVLAKAGLKVDDVVTALNGVPVDDAALLAKAYPLVRVAKAVTLTVKRNGEVVSLVYKVATRSRPLPPLPRREPLDDAGPEAPVDSDDPRIVRKSDTSYEVERSLVKELVEDGAARRARIVPYNQDGKVAGLKLFGIRRTSLLAQLGLKNGDLVLRANGRPLSSPEEALEIYRDAAKLSTLELEIERKGEKQTISYRAVD
jgi:membrane-associated protease RseP (regulator of RpoE activity)